MLNFKILNGKSLFFSKKHAQKTPLKNERKCRSPPTLNQASRAQAKPGQVKPTKSSKYAKQAKQGSKANKHASKQGSKHPSKLASKHASKKASKQAKQSKAKRASKIANYAFTADYDSPRILVVDDDDVD